MQNAIHKIFISDTIKQKNVIKSECTVKWKMAKEMPTLNARHVGSK